MIVVEKWQHKKRNNVWGSGREGDVVYQLFRLVIDCKGKDKSSSYLLEMKQAFNNSINNPFFLIKFKPDLPAVVVPLLLVSTVPPALPGHGFHQT